jgi:elongator complex protein 3
MAPAVDEPAARAILADPPASPEEVERRKRAWARGGAREGLPSNRSLLGALPPEAPSALRSVLRRKPSRTLSGVAIVAVMTAPARCPHGRCTYCPGGVDLGTPQSYTGEEPSALRGAEFAFDPLRITEHRLAALDAIGHPTSKVEVIVMGGTFPSRPATYRDRVFRGIFEGLNGRPSASLEEAHLANETAEHRCVGLTVETRPDWCDERVLPSLLSAGVTRVEIGVECLRDEVLKEVGRAHGTEEVVAATRAAKDAGLKVTYHLMLGLPGMDPAKDFADFVRLFDDPDFRPDMLKIYPTLVLPGTPLYDEWRAGRYSPYDLETAADLLAREKSVLPPWVRIQRIQRDIPARLIQAGVRKSNLREVALQRLAAQGRHCRCLRCREVGRRARPPVEAFRLTETTYAASRGVERFLAWEDPETDAVAGFLRLREPEPPAGPEAGSPIIRELKVLGSEVAVGESPNGPAEYQHRGFGRALLERAEEIAREAGFDRIRVTSAVGTRGYYRRRGYTPTLPYLTKSLRAA